MARVAQRCRLLGFLLLAPIGIVHGASPVRDDTGNVDLTGTVTDSTTGSPLQSAEISVAKATGGLVANTTTDAFGHFTIHNLAPGSYTVSAHFVGYRPIARPLIVPLTAAAPAEMNFAMEPIGLNLATFQVIATVPIAIDTRTGNQVFKQNDYHGAPTTTTSQILQESIAGAARAPTGEVHIRGQHAEYTYYVDGVPVPPGISGSLNELFDPNVVNSINFQTGGWDAEYGGRNAAIVNVTTKIPAGGWHGALSSNAGTYDHATTIGGRGYDGQGASVSDNVGAWGFYVAGTRQFSNMRLEPVVTDSSESKVINFHNNGTDSYGFGKVQYAPSVNNVVSLEVSDSRTRFAVPFDSTETGFQNDHQTDLNAFVNLAWHHQIGSTASGRTRADLFAALFYRHASLHYDADPHDQPQFVFFPDVTDTFNLAERRDANIYGIKLDYAYRPADPVEVKVGTLSSFTAGHENFSTFNAKGAQGPQSLSDLNGHDIGVYAQTAYTPTEWFELRTGARYDVHTAPFAGSATQLSPRVRLNFYPSTATTAYVYYGRQFIPTNIEDLRAVTSAAQGGEVSTGTEPERDDFFEGGVIHRFITGGVVAKLSAYYKRSNPGIDDNTVPGSAIVTDVNIAHVRITGIEGVVEFRPDSAFSAYLNAALNHAYGTGAITGGFFPASPPTSAFDLDHDQRLSILGSATYTLSRVFVSGTAIYGSGLTNGVDPSDCECALGTSLFDFNRGVHVAPSTILNASVGYAIPVKGSLLEPQVYVENLFDRTYLLKGAFFSGPSVGRPRSVQLQVKVTF